MSSQEDLPALDLSLSPVAVIVPLFSFLAVIFNLPVFYFHLKNRNLGAICLVFWILLSNLFNFLNAVIWPTDDLEDSWHGEVYCDIQVKLINGTTLGLVGAVASVMRGLAKALDTENTILVMSPAQRRRKILIDGLLCLGLPVYAMLIHIVVQPSRYYLFGIGGCTPSFDYSWVPIVLVYIWPVILCLLDAYYCGLVIYRIYRYRRDFSSIFSNSQSSTLTTSRFMRLFSISLLFVLVVLPVEGYILYRNTSFPLEPYSWKANQATAWSDIILVPSYGTVEFDRWIRIALGVALFLCFGLGREMSKLYQRWAVKCGLGKFWTALIAERLPSHRQILSFSNGSRRSSMVGKAKEYLVQKWMGRGSPARYGCSTPPLFHGNERVSDIEFSANTELSLETIVVTPSPTDASKEFPRLTTHLTQQLNYFAGFNVYSFNRTLMPS
ncbi:a-factor receptor [Agyrium rufum]|nr:a-factor receptor [Agyrium rufum]